MSFKCISRKPPVVNDGASVLCLPAQDTSSITPCNHGGGDSKIMVHVADAVRQGFHKIFDQTIDCDKVVPAVT